jgi:hypothetical protein
MRRMTLKPREEASQPIVLDPSYEQDHSPRIDQAAWEHEAQVTQQGAAVFLGLVRTLRQSLPSITEDQAKQAAHNVLALAARMNGRGRRL